MLTRSRKALNVAVGVAVVLASSLTLNLANAPTARALSSSPNRAWVTDGQVSSLTKIGSTVYFGGSFTSVRPHSGYGATVDKASGALDLAFPKVDGQVFAVANDGADGWYIGGDFTRVGGQARSNAARILSSGQVDPAWNPTISGTVRALVLSGTNVYVGGTFSNVAGSTRNNLAAVSAASGAVQGWNPNADGTVNALAVGGSTVYVGGTFANVGGAARSNIAALDASGAATAWNPNADAAVSSLAVGSGVVVAGGQFTTIGGAARNRVAALDAAGSATAWDANASGPVNALLLDGGTLYAAGDFTTIGGAGRSRLAGLDTTSALANGWNPGADGPVSALALGSGTLYVGGSFATLAGTSRSNAGAVSTSTAVATSWDPNTNGAVLALGLATSRGFIGGSFTGVGQPVARNRLAAIDETTNQLTSWNPGADGSVKALATDGSSVFVGGSFANVGGVARSRIAKVDMSGAATAWNPGANSVVNALVVSGSNLYVGGAFTTIAGTARNRLAALDVGTGSATAWNPNANAAVNALAVDGGTVFAGGGFIAVDGTARTYAAAINASATVSPYLLGWTADANGPVESLSTDASNLYLGGSFTTVSGMARSYVAAVNKTSAAVAGWNPSPNAVVHAVATESARVYAGGGFDTFSGSARRGLAQADNAAGSATAWNVTLDKDQTPFALIANASQLYAAGSLAGSQGFVARFSKPSVQFALASSSGVERTSPLNIAVLLSAADSEDTTVNYAITAGSATAGTDFTAASGTLTFPAGTTSASIVLNIVDDFQVEPNETVLLTLSSPSANAVLGSPAQHTFTILDDDVVPPDGASGPDPAIDRIPGSNATEQAIAVSKRRFATDRTAKGAILAQSGIIVDALAASPLANRLDATLLITPPSSLDAAVQTELTRALSSSTDVIILAGGRAALNDSVEQALRNAGFSNVQRLDGSNRRQTARLVADRIVAANATPTDTLYLVEDRAFVDALSVGAPAGIDNDSKVEPILLNPRGSSSIDSNLDSFLKAHAEVSKVKLVGGTTTLPAALASALTARFPAVTFTRISGADRFATNRALVEQSYSAPVKVVVARGDKGGLPGASSVGSGSSSNVGFFAALLADTLAADLGFPLLLVAPTTLPTPTADYLSANQASISQAIVVGSLAEISQAVEDRIKSLI